MTANVTDDIRAGLAARHEGQAATIAADVAVQKGHGDYIRRALATCITDGDDFTSETVRVRAMALAHIDGRDFDPAPNLLPAFIGGAASSGRIVEVGRVASRRPSRRASKISVYRPTVSAPGPHSGAADASPPSRAG